MTYYKNSKYTSNNNINLIQSQQQFQGENSEFPDIYKKTNKKKNNSVNRITINVADTQYQVVLDVCQTILNWRLNFDKHSKNWDVCWTDHAVSVDALLKMDQYQKINHFPGMSHLSRKNLLAKNLQRMQYKFAQQYDFFPKTWLLPQDYSKLRQFCQYLKKTGYGKTFIVKPEASCQGRGIYLTKNINQIQNNQHCIVQKYLTNPFLYKGLKFDLRIYVLLAGCEPLRIYIYNEGIVRLATQLYEKPNSDNIKNMYMHLTNYAINKDHPNFIFNQTQQNLNYGHKRSMAQFFQTLKLMGVNSVQVWADIKDNIVKTIISGQPHLAHQYRVSQPHNLENNMCFEILGFDFMINQQNKVYLLEINHTPSFSCQSPLDQLIKSNLIRDSLVLMNINKRNRQKALLKAKQIQQHRVFTGKTIRIDKTQRTKLISKYQKERDVYQDQNLGSYQKIYPSFNQQLQNKYQALLKFSEQSYNNSNISYDRLSNFNISKYPLKKIVLKRQSTNISIESNNVKNLQKVQKRTSLYNSSLINKKNDKLIIKFRSRSSVKLALDHDDKNLNRKIKERTRTRQIGEQQLNPEKQRKQQNNLDSIPIEVEEYSNKDQQDQESTIFNKYMHRD